MEPFELRCYIDGKGRKRFEDWFEGLDGAASAKVTIALTRMEQGTSRTPKALALVSVNTRSTSAQATAFILPRTDDGDRLVILIGGGTKKQQQKDIASAHECWAAYKRRKKQETR